MSAGRSHLAIRPMLIMVLFKLIMVLFAKLVMVLFLELIMVLFFSLVSLLSGADPLLRVAEEQ